jgi:calcineurin-like phosphoesterase family protein
MKPNKNNRKYWFISDIHVDHTNVLHLSNRPFKNIQEMEQTIVANINKVVRPNDVLILVGDVSLGKKESWVRFLASLVCKNVILIIGNHDRWASIPKDMLLFAAEQMTLRMHGRLFVVSHYPYRCSAWRAFWKRLHPSVLRPKRPRDNGLWLLHGHDHRATRLVPYHPRMLSVGCDANEYKPISGEEIVRIVQMQENSKKEIKERENWSCLLLKKIGSLHWLKYRTKN